MENAWKGWERDRKPREEEKAVVEQAGGAGAQCVAAECGGVGGGKGRLAWEEAGGGGRVQKRTFQSQSFRARQGQVFAV